MCYRASFYRTAVEVSVCFTLLEGAPSTPQTIAWFLLYEKILVSRCLGKNVSSFSHIGVVCVWVYAVHVSGSDVVVSYFWAPLTCCWTHCTAVRVVQCSKPPPKPHFWQRLSTQSAWLQSSHTLRSILSLQTETLLPLEWTPLSLCGPDRGPLFTKDFSHTHKATPASSCKGNPPDVVWPH